LGGTLASAHHVWFGETVIRSCCKLDYGTAQRMVGGVMATDGTSGGDIPACPYPAAPT
jgi:DIS3-like exonuclease 2